MPPRYWFEDMENATFTLPQNPGRLVTIHALPRLAAAVGIGALGFRHVDEFTEWLDTPAVAPFFDEFRTHFNLRRNMFYPRVEYPYMYDFWCLLTQAQQQAYMSADGSGLPVDRRHWSPRQHYLRFTSAIIHHRNSDAGRSNPDIWPYFDGFPNHSRIQLPQGVQAWLVLGFLIVREQLDLNNRGRSPSPDRFPRTPERGGRSATRSPTATPGTPLRVSPQFGRLPPRPRRRRGPSPEGSEMDSLFGDNMPDELLDEPPILRTPSPLPPFVPSGPVDFSTWFTVLATVGRPGSTTIVPGVIPSAAGPDQNEAGLVMIPMPRGFGLVDPNPVQVVTHAGGHIDWYYLPPDGALERRTEFAADGSHVETLVRGEARARAAAMAAVAAAAAAQPGGETEFQRESRERLEAAFRRGIVVPSPMRDYGDDNGGEGPSRS